MSLVFTEHPLRRTVAAELHARDYEPLQAPEKVSHIAVMCGDKDRGRNIEHLKKLLAHYAAPIPETLDQHHAADLGPLRLRWERHTEFVTYTFAQQGEFRDPFTDPVLNQLPEDWLRGLPGDVIAAVSLSIEACETPERDHPALSALFDGNPVIGSGVVGGKARVWSDLRIHSDGFVRILVRDCGMSQSQAGRLAKRMLDINCYRALGLLGFPVARAVFPALGKADRQLAKVALRMTMQNGSSDPGFESELLAELTGLASEIEALAARTTYRFDASRAYYGVIQQKLEQLRQQRIEGLQTFSEFLSSRLAPAIATCEATQHRQTDLADRAARLTSLLRARVEVALQEQNRRLLESMDRRAHLQLRLQETVEGLSIVAIGYYGVGLIGYGLKGLEESGVQFNSGVPFNAEIGMAIALPIVLGVGWIALKRLKRRATNSA